MSEKSNGGMTRREATHKILSVIALATGLSISEVRSLLAQVKTITTVKPAPVSTTLSRTTIVPQKAANDKVKALKVLLENSTEVFENEYGRMTPIQTGRMDALFTGKVIPPDLAGNIVNMCGVHFNPAGSGIGATGVMGCSGTNTCTGQELSGSGGDGEPCWGTNTCSGQKCPQQEMCGDNTCEDQECPKFKFCDKNKESLTSAEYLSDIAGDVYIQLLFQEFNVTTVDALHTQLDKALNTLSVGKALQWPLR